MTGLKTLLLGWGNPDRQDDGAAWHILAGVARRFGLSVPAEIGEVFPGPFSNLVLDYDLQLVPEKAELVAAHDRVLFIDAHTGAINEDLSVRKLVPGFQTSPLTHHLTAESVLDLASGLYGHAPPAWLLSIRGYQFGFANELSPETTALVEEAVSWVCSWLESGSNTAD